MSMEIKAWRKSHSGKAYTVRIGSAWTDKNGRINLDFDALPVVDAEGKVRVFLEDRTEREERRADDRAPF